MMNGTMIAEIFRRVLNDELLLNWRFHFLVLALVVVSAAIASFFGAYLAKRGEAKAAKEGFADLKRDLAETTTLTKRIETSLAHGDWAKREFRTLRRTKLEDLMIGVYGTKRWLEQQRMAPFPTGHDDSQSPLVQVSMLGLLYFPEMKDELGVLRELHGQIVMWALGAREKSLKLEADSNQARLRVDRHGDDVADALAEMAAIHAQHMALINEERDTFLEIYKHLHPIIDHIEGAAKSLMREAITAEEHDALPDQIAP